MLSRNPGYAAGFAISAALVLVKSIQVEAERIAAAAPPDGGASGPSIRPPAGRVPGFAGLLQRGTVAVIRTDAERRLVDVSVVARVPAAEERLLAVLRAPDSWPSFLSSVKECVVRSREPSGMEYRMAIDGVILDVDSVYKMQFLPHGVDVLAIDGDLRRARYRFDLSPTGPAATTAVYRGNAHLGEASTVLRMLFRHEPLFEHSANVAVGIIATRAMAWQAARLAREEQQRAKVQGTK
jgi:hypothetical protein